MAGMSSLSATISTEVKWTAQNNLTGQVYQPVGNTGDIRKNYNIGTSVANNASGGADEFFSFQQVILAGASVTVDLTQMTNILTQAAVGIVRIKGYQIRLLSPTLDDTTIQTPAASAITLTNGMIGVPNQLDFGNGGSGLTLALTTFSGSITSVAIGSGGSGYPPSSTFLVAPVQSGGSGGACYVSTNASGIVTAANLAGSPAGGTGYSNATVPTVVTGQYPVAQGGAHVYFDPSAAGFATVSSTAKNVSIINNDAANKATVEITVIGATT
jgi:hypothetical protein